ncbi:hypothetical protein [Flavobacterium salmonis]|uniref:Uncharacterized protein n=1 Tax=Flavobacterium salmonis TaxID=2654844 RepID=A0A6V6YY59_9FLAO|nr:hypothetical protein [Flavobacterium salmonis]CAD0004259.1 hypothetical protein FLAT13_02156 [Flavobacterium salmonis]
MRDSHLIQKEICTSMRTGFLFSKLNRKLLIVNKVIRKIIWIIDFFDFIFAEENQNKDFQIKMISKYNTTYKMIFDLKIYSLEQLHPGRDLGCKTIQVYEHGQ